jgi:hypothetical protein
LLLIAQLDAFAIVLYGLLLYLLSLSFLMTSKLLQLDAAVASSQLRSAAKLIYYAAFAAAYALAGAAADLVRRSHSNTGPLSSWRKRNQTH